MQKLKDLNFPILIGGLLLIGTLITLNIVVLNAEALVALCFVLFVLFAYSNFSNIVIDMLEERTNKIQKDFNYYFELQEEVLTTLISYHKKRITLSEEINEISFFSKTEIENILNKRQKELENIILEQIEQKLKTILIKETSITQMIQKETSSWFSKSVYNQFQSNKTSSFSKDILLQEGIALINKMSEFDIKKLIKVQDIHLLSQVVMIHKHLDISMDILIIGALSKF